jgi:hypothetical protein
MLKKEVKVYKIKFIGILLLQNKYITRNKNEEMIKDW